MILKNHDNQIIGLKLFTPKKHFDDRGCFFETFNKADMQLNEFVQDNHSISKKGVIRGMHLQLSPHEQSKLVRVIKGRILDVIIDFRKESKTYLNIFSIELNEDNGIILLVPKGCLHGFLSLEDNTIVNYKVDDYWNKECEFGIKWNDPILNINWQLQKYNISNPIISEKDQALQNYKQI